MWIRHLFGTMAFWYEVIRVYLNPARQDIILHFYPIVSSENLLYTCTLAFSFIPSVSSNTPVNHWWTYIRIWTGRKKIHHIPYMCEKWDSNEMWSGPPPFAQTHYMTRWWNTEEKLQGTGYQWGWCRLEPAKRIRKPRAIFHKKLDSDWRKIDETIWIYVSVK